MRKDLSVGRVHILGQDELLGRLYLGVGLDVEAKLVFLVRAPNKHISVICKGDGVAVSTSNIDDKLLCKGFNSSWFCIKVDSHVFLWSIEAQLT